MLINSLSIRGQPCGMDAALCRHASAMQGKSVPYLEAMQKLASLTKSAMLHVSAGYLHAALSPPHAEPTPGWAADCPGPSAKRLNQAWVG